jgi:shikimate kinase
VNQRRSQSLNIALCGFYGCGKTSTGWELARRMRRHFVDVPQELARRSKPSLINVGFWGRNVATAEDAEPRLVAQLMDRRDLVVSLSAESLDDRFALSETTDFSYLVFLDPPFEQVYERLKTMPAHRERAERLGRFGMLEEFERRRPLYEHCDLQLTCADVPSQLAGLILHCFCT